MKKIFVLKEPIDKISNAEDLFDKIKHIDIDYSREHFIVITLTSKNQVIKEYVVSIGTLNASLVHPREVFRNAIFDDACSVILAHNHPSGFLKPSDEDITITKNLVKAGNILGIRVLDHIIFNVSEYLSMRERESDIF